MPESHEQASQNRVSVPMSVVMAPLKATFQGSDAVDGLDAFRRLESNDFQVRFVSR